MKTRGAFLAFLATLFAGVAAQAQTPSWTAAAGQRALSLQMGRRRRTRRRQPPEAADRAQRDPN